MTRTTLAAALLALGTTAVPAGESRADSLTLFASGEDLATEGFTAPELTRDGWALAFDRILVTLDAVTAWRSDPPFMADGPTITGAALPLGGPFTVDLVDADDDDRVAVATVPAEAGFYNALSFALVPAVEGEFAGFSLVLQGTARRDGQEVDFILATRDAIAHACGEYVGDARLGFVTADAGGEVEITLHLDHIFGSADMDADDPTNMDALGFAAFAAGGMQEFSLDGLHVAHVGEGHCHDTPL